MVSPLCLNTLRAHERRRTDPHVLSLLATEPTSALDNNTAALVEETLLRKDEQGRKQACIWITHSDEQAKRVADATLDLTPFLTSRGATEREQEEV